MTACFYNDSAQLIGIDLHHAQVTPTGVTEVAYGHRQDGVPYLVFVTHGWWGGDDDKRTPDVTADGEKMIRDGFKLSYVPHAPIPGLPYYWSEPIETAKIVKDSSSTPLLKMSSVTSHGDALHVCAIGPVGANVDCQDDGPMLTGIVICECSVVTAPSLKDLVFRLFDDYLKKLLIQWIIALIDKLLAARGLPAIPRAVVKWLLKKIVPPIVDLLEDLAKWMWDKSSEPKKPEPPRALPPPQAPEEPRPYVSPPRKWWNPFTWGDLP